MMVGCPARSGKRDVLGQGGRVVRFTKAQIVGQRRRGHPRPQPRLSSENPPDAPQLGPQLSKNGSLKPHTGTRHGAVNGRERGLRPGSVETTTGTSSGLCGAVWADPTERLKPSAPRGRGSKHRRAFREGRCEMADRIRKDESTTSNESYGLGHRFAHEHSHRPLRRLPETWLADTASSAQTKHRSRSAPSAHETEKGGPHPTGHTQPASQNNRRSQPIRVRPGLLQVEKRKFGNKQPDLVGCESPGSLRLLGLHPQRRRAESIAAPAIIGFEQACRRPMGKWPRRWEANAQNKKCPDRR